MLHALSQNGAGEQTGVQVTSLFCFELGQAWLASRSPFGDETLRYKLLVRRMLSLSTLELIESILSGYCLAELTVLCLWLTVIELPSVLISMNTVTSSLGGFALDTTVGPPCGRHKWRGTEGWWAVSDSVDGQLIAHFLLSTRPPWLMILQIAFEEVAPVSFTCLR